MPLFSHREHDEPVRHPWDPIPGLAAAATGQGWQPAGDRPFAGHLESPVHEISRWMYGAQRGGPLDDFVVSPTSYTDAYRGTISGRTVVVANAWTTIGGARAFGKSGTKGTAVCAVEVGGLLPVAFIQPRQFRPMPMYRLLVRPTGDPAFDERYIVNASGPEVLSRVLPGLAQPQDMLTPDVRQRIMAHDDWTFRFEDYWLGCIARGHFASVDDVTQRISEMLGIVAAIPASVVPDHIDHSADDVVARFSRFDSVDQALAELQALTPDDRDRLRQSDSPLAAFADVRTPLEAMAIFQELDAQRRTQLLAMFQRVTGE